MQEPFSLLAPLPPAASLFAFSTMPGVFLLALALAAVFSAVLAYHWVRYGKNIINMKSVGTIYLAGVLFSLGMMFFGMQ